jgi:hypothetical protein
MTDAGVETAAVTVIRSGVDLDNKKRYTEALVCYREGIQLLLNLLKGLSAFFCFVRTLCLFSTSQSRTA